MMDLQEYFASLDKALVAGGMPENQSAAYCKRLAKGLQSLDEAAREEKLKNYGSAEELAARVLALAQKQKAGENGAQSESPAEEKKEEAPARPLEHTINVDAGRKKAQNSATRPIQVVQSDESAPEAEEKTSAPPTKAPSTPSAQPEENAKKPMSKRGMQIFWWTAGLTSPLSAFLLFALASLFAAGYAALVVLAVAMIVAVTVTVVGGILISLICLAYGIVKMLPGTDAFFIGLYEFGLGTIAVGGTIVFSILEYNVATVLVPFTIKKLTVFLKFTIRQIKRLVQYLYGLCRDL